MTRRLSDVISELERLERQHGDVPVKAAAGFYEDDLTIEVSEEDELTKTYVVIRPAR